MAIINPSDPGWASISIAIQSLQGLLNATFTPDQAAQLWAANILRPIAANYANGNFQNDFYDFITKWVNPA